MKFYFVDDIHYRVFVNNIISNVDLKNKNQLEQLLKKIIKWIDYKYNVSINGLFEVDIFSNDKVGAFIEFEKLNSIIFYKDTDLKINIIYNCNFYLKTTDFEILEQLEEVYYNDGYYYINIENLYNLDNYIEFGDIIYDNKLNLERNYLRIK